MMFSQGSNCGDNQTFSFLDNVNSYEDLACGGFDFVDPNHGDGGSPQFTVISTSPIIYDGEGTGGYLMSGVTVTPTGIPRWPVLADSSKLRESGGFVVSSDSVVVSRRGRAELKAKAAFARRCAEKRKGMRDRSKVYAECEADLHVRTVKHDHTCRGRQRGVVTDKHKRWLTLLIDGRMRMFEGECTGADRDLFLVHFVSTLFYLSGFLTPDNAAFSEIVDSLGTTALGTLEGLVDTGGYLYHLYFPSCKYTHTLSIVQNRLNRIMRAHSITETVLRNRLSYSSIFNLSNLQLSCLRLLLLIAGIEPNPGPAQSKSVTSPASKQPRKKLDVKRNQPDAAGAATAAAATAKSKSGSNAGKQAIIDSIKDTCDRLQGTEDAMAELKSSEGCIVVTDDDGNAKLVDPKDDEIASLKAQISQKDSMNTLLHTQLGRYEQFKPFLSELEADNVQYHTCFPGRFDGYKSTFNDGDDLNYVWICKDDTWKVLIPGCTFSTLTIPNQLVAMAARSCCSEDLVLRFKNIMACLRSSSESKAIIDADPVKYGFTLAIIGFVLTGVVEKSGSTRWLNDVKEGVPIPYRVQPMVGWEDALKGVHFMADLMKVQATMARKVRRGKFFLTWLTCYIPDWGDPMTLRAGLYKRLFPKLPRRTHRFAVLLERRARELGEYIHAHAHVADAAIELTPTEESFQILEKALKGRPADEAAQVREGFEAFMNDAHSAIEEYLNTPYDCFFKLECYPEASRKPPRFIMSLPPKMRGVQVAAMGRILDDIEFATKKCNVKGLTKEEIYEKMLKKFQDVPLCVETDYSSFESCISPELKDIVENQIFEMLNDGDPGTAEFIARALKRHTVPVRGPGFVIPHFHHIRMSGDYWTSLGNLLSNFVITSVLMNMSVEQFIDSWIIEGDDGAGPSPTLTGMSLSELEERAKECGVLLTFAEAPWQSLSFCGNHFEVVECHYYRHRDPSKVLMGLTCLYGADPTNDAFDAMLQRSKAISVISDSWVPGASVFACCIEYLTRGIKVNENYLLTHGLLKEYSSYGLEKCIPNWLATCTNVNTFARRVSERDLQCGGICTQKMVLRLLTQMVKNNGAGEERIIGDYGSSTCYWEDRDGLGTVIRKDGRRSRRVEHTATAWYGSVAEQLGLPAVAPQTYTRHSRHRIYNHAHHQWFRPIWNALPDRDDFWGLVRLWTILISVLSIVFVMFCFSLTTVDQDFCHRFGVWCDDSESVAPSASFSLSSPTISAPNETTYRDGGFRFPELNLSHWANFSLNISMPEFRMPNLLSHFSPVFSNLTHVATRLMGAVHQNDFASDACMIALQFVISVSFYYVSKILRKIRVAAANLIPGIGNLIRFFIEAEHALIDFGMVLCAIFSIVEEVICVIHYAGFF